MIFKNELPLDHEPSLDYMAQAWATENVESAVEDEDDYYSSNWDYEYEMSWSAIESDLESEGLDWEYGKEIAL